MDGQMDEGIKWDQMFHGFFLSFQCIWGSLKFNGMEWILMAL